jgi:hypothetical protein
MISVLVTPPIWQTQTFFPDPIFVYGDPLANFGFTNFGAINGLGLVTRGLLWQQFDMWCDVDYYKDQNASPTTVWTSPQYGMFGVYPTI